MEIIYEDKNLIAVNKPADMVVFGEESSLINLLIKEYPELKIAGDSPRYGIIHRLDRDTSGILLIAKNTGTLLYLQNQFKERNVDKRYLTLVHKKVKEKEGIINNLIGRCPKNRLRQCIFDLIPYNQKKKGLRESYTEWKLIKHIKDFSLLDVRIETGRKHQIRVHMQGMNHPIAGDTIYTGKGNTPPQGLKRQFLHAHYLKVKLANNKILELKTDLPKNLKSVIINLEK